MQGKSALMVRLALGSSGSDSSGALFPRCLFARHTGRITLVCFDRPLFEEASGEVAAFSPVKLQHRRRNNRTADRRGKRKQHKKTRQRAACERQQKSGGRVREGTASWICFKKFHKKDDGDDGEKKSSVSDGWRVGGVQPAGIYSADKPTRSDPRHVAAGCRALRSCCAPGGPRT